MNRLSKLVRIVLALCLLTALIQEVQIYFLDKRAEPLIRELQNLHPGLDAIPGVVAGVVAGVSENFVGVAAAVIKVARDVWFPVGRMYEIKQELGVIAAYYHTLILWRNSTLVAACALGAVEIVRYRRMKKTKSSAVASS